MPAFVSVRSARVQLDPLRVQVHEKLAARMTPFKELQNLQVHGSSNHPKN